MYTDSKDIRNKSENALIILEGSDIEFLIPHPAILKRMKELSTENSLRAFITNRNVGSGNGGFSWSNTAEDSHFWSEVLDDRNPIYFYTQYPSECPDEFLELFASNYPQGREEKERRESLATG